MLHWIKYFPIMNSYFLKHQVLKEAYHLALARPSDMGQHFHYSFLFRNSVFAAWRWTDRIIHVQPWAQLLWPYNLLILFLRAEHNSVSECKEDVGRHPNDAIQASYRHPCLSESICISKFLFLSFDLAKGIYFASCEGVLKYEFSTCINILKDFS